MNDDWKTALGDALKTLDCTVGELWTLSGTERVGRWGRVIEEVIHTDQGTIRNAVRTLTIRNAVYSAAIATNSEITHEDGSVWRVRGSFSEDSLSRTLDMIALK